ncbi:YcbK family protein [Pseudomonas putida]|nr:DUF882 domain-containing protein [Pseudomonas putida]
MKSRNFFCVFFLFSSFLVMAESVRAGDWRDNLLNQDRCLTLHRPETKEVSNFCYWRKGTGIDVAGYKKANWILRDWQDNQQTVMDIHLLNTLFLMQKWLIIEGRSGEIRILSGYRTPRHNARLDGAAKQSQHMKGKAADIYIPAVSTRLLAAMSRLIGVGGVGIYPKKNYVHVDTAGVRTWVK